MIKPRIRKVWGANRYICSYADRYNVFLIGIGETGLEAYKEWVERNRDRPYYLTPTPEPTPEPEVPQTERILTRVFVGLIACISTLFILNGLSSYIKECLGV